MNAKKKEEPTIKTRPAGKLPPGSAFQRIGRLADGTQMAEILGLTGHEQTPPATGTSGTGSTTGTPGTGGTPGTSPVAPARDYMKVANSIHRDAVPGGLFKGKSKQTYDFLYSRTRGAIVPTRSVQVSWREIMKGARIGSDKTLREHLKHLRDVGLVTWEWEDGSQRGSVYTVYLPEEATGTPGTPGTGSTGGQFLPQVPEVISTGGTGGLNNTAQTASDNSKTSFKTNTERSDDDAALAGLVTILNQLSKELTGREASASERERWNELAEVLATEAKIAGARTTVSSLPAFLAEHLRRRLWKRDKSQLESEGRAEAQQPSTAPSLTEEQIKSCPDCGGSTWYYPEGTEKGIKRCRHDKLKAGKGSDTV